MTDTKDISGPAFAYGNHEQGGDPGMSLRDYFAGQALAGFLGSDIVNQVLAKDATEKGTRAGKHAATIAYEYADAMLRAREQGEG
jgi:hypothetical protein